jgi:hypothetical protein
VADAGLVSPRRAVEAGEVATIGDFGAAASPKIIDVDPMSSRPGSPDDLVKDQPQIEQAPRGPETFGAQVCKPCSLSPRLPRRKIDWNDTPSQDDIFEDNEDMQALQTSIMTINLALMVSLLTMHFS